MRIVLLLIVAMIVASGAWCDLCRLSVPAEDNPEGESVNLAKFKIGDPYQILGGKSLLNLEKKEPGLVAKLQWHSWIQVESGADRCIYSFGLVGDVKGDPVEMVTPDPIVEACYNRLSACLSATAKGSDYDVGSKERKLKVARTAPHECLFVCQGIEGYVRTGVNKNHPKFDVWQTGKLNEDQVAIIHWLIVNKTRSNERGSRITIVPFQLSFYCSLPGAQFLNNWKKGVDPDVMDVTNCQTFASNFDTNPADLLKQLKAYKPLKSHSDKTIQH